MKDDFRIDSIRMRNFRCFHVAEITFNACARDISIDGQEREVGPLTVIVAKNGMGKSTLLDAVRIAFGTLTSAFDYPSPVHIAKSDIRIAPGHGVQDFILTLPVSITAHGRIQGKQVCWSRTLSKETGRTSVKDARCISEFGARLKQALQRPEDEPSTILPLVAYYGTSRLWRDHKETDKERLLAKPRDFGYAYCLEGNSNYKTVCRWIKDALWAELTATQIDLGESVTTHQLRAIRSALSVLLKQEGYDSSLHFNPYFKELAIVRTLSDNEGGEGKVSIPISALSDGVRAIFSMVSDIAFRCAKLNPQFGEDACLNTPGLVLVDEIDQHLHPAWQQTVLDTLQASFPKMQFIVTTHSPQVLSSVPKECVRIIDNGDVILPQEQTQGVESQDILANIFGTAPSPQGNRYVRLLDDYARLVSDGRADTPEAKEHYRQLAAHFGKHYPPLSRIELQHLFMQKK